MDFEAVIGLEVHCQLSTESKIFCGCRARVQGSVADVAANSNTCPVCTAQPITHATSSGTSNPIGILLPKVEYAMGNR